MRQWIKDLKLNKSVSREPKPEFQLPTTRMSEGEQFQVLEGDGSKIKFPPPKYTPKTLEEIRELVNKKDEYFIWINELTGEYLINGENLSVHPKAKESLCFLLENFGFLCSYTALMNKIGSKKEVYKYMSILRNTNGGVLRKYIINSPTEGYQLTGNFKYCIIRRLEG